MRDRASLVIIALAFMALGLCGTAVLAVEPIPDGKLGQRVVPLLLLSRPDVRADLGLDEKQAADADREISALYAKALTLRGKTGPDVIAARRELDAAQQRWLEANLSANQFRRLVEIDLQWEGPSALISRPVIADRLRLDPAQVASLKQAAVERDKARASRSPSSDAEARFARAALAILSDQQKGLWHEMLGKPFAPRLANAGGAPANPKR